MNQGGGDPGKSGLRRRRRTYSRTQPEHLKSGKHYGQEANQQRAGDAGTGYQTLQLIYSSVIYSFLLPISSY